MQPLEQLFVTHHMRVLRAAYRVTGSMEDAEDVAQVVFMRLSQSGDVASIGNAESYLYRAAVNAGLDMLRKRQHERKVPLDDALALVSGAPEGSPERNYSSAELRTWLRQALGRLGPRAGEMFVLRYLEDRDNGEIARMLKTSQAVVAVMLHRARARLKKDFQQYLRGKR
jgi:RNA polymerase sigma-70 factor (ECF subfamily)